MLTTPYLVLLWYDLLITTGEEVRCFWGRRVTGAAILFWLNKYMTTLYFVWDLQTFFTISDKVCATLLTSLWLGVKFDWHDQFD